MRLDNYLVAKGYFLTRNKAQSAIKGKRVKVNDMLVIKTGYEVNDLDLIELSSVEFEFVSRGGYKLLKAIKEFNLDFKDKVIIDLGASTGGFSDCALKFNAKKVYAVDVGTNQLDQSLLFNKKIISIENQNIKNLNSSKFADIDFIVMDVSFISITKLIFKLKELMKNQVQLIVLIKPQFEVMNQNINHNGAVKNKNIHYDVIKNIINKFKDENIYLNNLTYSPLKGEKSGNIEYLALFSLENKNVEIDIMNIINSAYNELI